MGKRSDFARNPRDHYPTPRAAVTPLLPWLAPGTRFCEPCAGDGRLRDYLVEVGHYCVAAWDIAPQHPSIDKQDARTRLIGGNINCFITNPPWDRPVLHALIDNLASQHQTWLLIDADWLHTKQANGYWQRAALVVSVGRVKWIEGSKHTGKDNCCWYLFYPGHTGGPHLVGR